MRGGSTAALMFSPGAILGWRLGARYLYAGVWAEPDQSLRVNLYLLSIMSALAALPKPVRAAVVTHPTLARCIDPSCGEVIV